MQNGKRRLVYKQQIYHTLGGKDDERQTDMQKAPKLCMWGLFRFAVSECHIHAAAPDSAVMGEFNTFSVKDVVNAKVCAAVIVDLLINDKV